MGTHAKKLGAAAKTEGNFAGDSRTSSLPRSARKRAASVNSADIEVDVFRQGTRPKVDYGGLPVLDVERSSAAVSRVCFFLPIVLQELLLISSGNHSQVD